MAGPESEVIRINRAQLVVQSRNVIDQSQVFDGVEMGHRSRVETEAGERKNARPLPLADYGLYLGRPHQVGLVRSRGSISIGDLHVIVWAADLVLRAIAAEEYMLAEMLNIRSCLLVEQLTIGESFRRIGYVGAY